MSITFGSQICIKLSRTNLILVHIGLMLTPAFREDQ